MNRDNGIETPMFDAMARVVAETLGTDHVCARALTRKNMSCGEMEAAVDAIFTLHPLHRHRVFAEATRSLTQYSDLLRWMLRKAPSSETRH